MNKIFKINKKTAFVIYIILDILSVVILRGVPIFSILFGFPVGWYIARRLELSERNLQSFLVSTLKYSFYTSLITFFCMVIIWGPVSTMLMNPNADFANFGIPMILFYPKISFIGWIILMVFISPFLQLLTTVFASNVTLWRLSESKKELNGKVGNISEGETL
jgi:hypothetical protein